MHKPSIEITPKACFFMAGLLLILPMKWIFAAIMAAAIHEFCHCAMLRIFGIPIYNIRVDVNETVLETGQMNTCKELICALAGPMGSFLLLGVSKWCPLLSICAGIHGMYNLIPVLPFDGGRVLNSILEICCPKVRQRTMAAVRIIMCCLILFIGILGLRLGTVPLIMSCIMVGKMMPRKRPCKERLKRVQ